MITTIWHDFLYQPLFNALIWIYNNWTSYNFGWAVVYLTILLRFALLPFTILSERAATKNAALHREVHKLERELRNDPVLKKEEIRKILRARHVTPWSKIVVLGTQLLVLVLLYQVFIRGITGEKVMKILYPFVNFPGAINLDFYGFNLGAVHTLFWPAAVAILLMAEIYIDYRSKHDIKLNKADLLYFIAFPAASFLLLWWLPMVKSLFILSSMCFSIIIHQIMKLFFRAPKPGSAN
ncbi:MAG TPA: YidC/Oxa1 family membrane protein insertase [Candidatus Magasanikbacteria bacterium]|nr:YidC/Oxa1 family membrane protein insertase [Candidatus Magasanikbacteria bacterium]